MADNYLKISQIMALAMLLGSIPFGYIILYLKSPKAAKEVGRDTCDLSVLGKGEGFFAHVMNIAKGYIPVYLAAANLSLKWAVATAVIVVVSAAFPYWLMFKPSKAAQSALLGAFFALIPYMLKLCK